MINWDSDNILRETDAKYPPDKFRSVLPVSPEKDSARTDFTKHRFHQTPTPSFWEILAQAIVPDFVVTRFHRLPNLTRIFMFKNESKKLTSHIAILVGLTTLLVADGLADDAIDFNRDIRPLLSDRCYKCHGPDENSRESDLRFDKREFAAGSFAGESAEDIEFLVRIFSEDADEQMPPPDSNLKLLEAEKKLLKKWIEQGAPYAGHWAFERPVKAALPPIKNSSWPQNEIDHFVLSKLEANRMTPSRRAGKERLLRRVTFDLTGLPPTLEEIEAFAKDDSPDAFEKVVDDLLKRPAYGERMTSEWLDVARYSDSFGYQVDRGRHVWPWRDWVIAAFNNNMPYSQFVLEQLAGDMLPNATDKQILATAFNRLHPQKVEGGSVPEEFRVEYVADRTHTVATAFLGLTFECSRCHDHKYDPISQKEYYQLFAYFNNIDEAGLYSYFTSSTPTPTLLLSSEDQKKKLADLEKQIQTKAERLQRLVVDEKAFEKWLDNNDKKILTPPIESNSFENYKHGRNQTVAGKFGKAVKLTGDDAIGLKTGNFSRNQPFSISLWIQTPDVKKRAVVLHRSRAWTDAGSRGYQLLIEDGKLSASLIHFWPGNAIRIKTVEPLALNEWIHVGLSYDGSSQAKGMKLYLNGRSAQTEIVRDNLYKNITGGGGNNISIGERFRDLGFKNGQVDEINVFDKRLTDIEFKLLYDQTLADELPKVGKDSLTAEQRKNLMSIFARHHDPKRNEIKSQLKSLRDQRSKLVDGVVEIMVMNDMAKRRPTYLLERGAYDKRADQVEPALPEIFGADRNPTSRLELARWLVSDQNPLTARVTVNRYWQLIFGEGLVRTPEDFGSQGQAPTHPELLDWLAKDFMESGWNLKRLIKNMVTSATYQQDSILNEKFYQQDPDNLLLSRSFSFRLPAEMLRDNALFASSILVQKVGGAGAKPYDLPLSFKPIGADSGEGLYRRSVYTYWKRTGPSPVMMTLDASKRDVCTVKREKTATPLQSFVLLNDPQFVESARMLAALELEQQADPLQSIPVVFEKLSSRRPTAREIRLLSELYQTQKKYFDENPKATDQYLAVGKKRIDGKLDKNAVAALATVVQTIMNFDECVMRR